MRNRNVRESDHGQKNHTKPVNPFDSLSSYEYVSMVCSTCKQKINNLNLMEVQWITDNRGQPFDRISFFREKELRALEQALKEHPCLSQSMIEHEVRITEQEMISEKENLAEIRKILKKIYEPTAEELFKIGMWVINTESGQTFKIDNVLDLEVIVGGYNNGKRNVMPYE